MNIERGDVVLVQWPFGSGAGSKLRPALVVQSDRNNRRIANTIVAMITSTTYRSGEATQLIIDPASQEERGSGLRFTSVVTCENVFTIRQHLISRKIGRLSESAIDEIDTCLKVSLGLE